MFREGMVGHLQANLPMSGRTRVTKMSINETISVINQMEADGIIGRYAIGGAVAAINYLEPALTEDLDILVSFDEQVKQSRSGLVTLGPITRYLAEKGFSEFRKEGIVIAGWPVQFLPVAKPLDAEGLAEAVTVDFRVDTATTIKCRILRAEHLMATALDVGRPKDYARITQFIEAGAFDPTYLCGVLVRNNLTAKWQSFCDRFEIANPCDSVHKL
jgi:hypothetical protein